MKERRRNNILVPSIINFQDSDSDDNDDDDDDDDDDDCDKRTDSEDNYFSRAVKLIDY